MLAWTSRTYAGQHFSTLVLCDIRSSLTDVIANCVACSWCSHILTMQTHYMFEYHLLTWMYCCLLPVVHSRLHYANPLYVWISSTNMDVLLPAPWSSHIFTMQTHYVLEWYLLTWMYYSRFRIPLSELWLERVTDSEIPILQCLLWLPIPQQWHTR